MKINKTIFWSVMLILIILIYYLNIQYYNIYGHIVVFWQFFGIHPQHWKTLSTLSYLTIFGFYFFVISKYEFKEKETEEDSYFLTLIKYIFFILLTAELLVFFGFDVGITGCGVCTGGDLDIQYMR